MVAFMQFINRYAKTKNALRGNAMAPPNACSLLRLFVAQINNSIYYEVIYTYKIATINSHTLTAPKIDCWREKYV